MHAMQDIFYKNMDGQVYKLVNKIQDLFLFPTHSESTRLCTSMVTLLFFVASSCVYLSICQILVAWKCQCKCEKCQSSVVE